MNTLTHKQRSKNMSHIKSKNTSLEIAVRKRLFADGFRYRINVSDLPGKPDIVLPKYRTVIFVNGYFWHRHNCKRATIPKTNTDYWMSKFEKNVQNDEKKLCFIKESWMTCNCCLGMWNKIWFRQINFFG